MIKVSVTFSISPPNNHDGQRTTDDANDAMFHVEHSDSVTEMKKAMKRAIFVLWCAVLAAPAQEQVEGGGFEIETMSFLTKPDC